MPKTEKDMGKNSIERKSNPQKFNTKGTVNCGVPDKSLTLIPFRFAIEMINRGWILRNTIIWHKPNCMPSSAKDRFTVDFEYVFFFVKNKRYFFEAQYEPIKESTIQRERYGWNGVEIEGRDSPQATDKMGTRWGDPNIGRNKRTVWSICPQPFPEAHFAVYPEELCQTPIKSGCPEFVCKKCGKAREKVYDVSYQPQANRWSKKADTNIIKKPTDRNVRGSYEENLDAIRKFKGYTQCSCNAGFEGGIVLDQFMGAGTTALVALKQNKRFIGFEINNQYIDIANKRIKPYLEQRKLTDIVR